MRWSFSAILLMALTAMAPSRAASGPATLRTDHASYALGENFKVAFTNAPGNPKDWIGIFPAGLANPEGTIATQWFYVDGTKGGSTAVVNGEVNFSSLATTGSYTAYLFENDGYRIFGKDTFTVVEATAPLVRVDKQVYRKGDAITVNFSRGPGNAKDWIAIYGEGVVPGTGSAAYLYVDGTTSGQVGKTDGSVTFNGFLTPGKWTAHLLEDDGYTSLASDSFEIVLTGNGLATLIPDHQHYLPGQPVSIQFDGGHGNPLDWIGVYKLGQRQPASQSTDWRYVNDTQAGTDGITKGSVNFPNGFSSGVDSAQSWRADFMLNDGYEIIGDATFDVLLDGSPIVQTSKRTYDFGETISITFQNGPGNAKDWIAIYPKGIIPDGDPSSTLWKYTDGTTDGTTPTTSGTIDFTGGLSDAGDWTVFLLQDDGYTILASEDFSVKSTVTLAPRIVSASPDDGSTAPASPDLKVVLENRDTSVDVNSLAVKLDNAAVSVNQSLSGAFLTVTATTTNVFAQGSAHTYVITYKDTAGTTASVTNHFVIGAVVAIDLPTPLFFESFDGVAEGSLPAGWTASHTTTASDVAADLGNLGSLAYADFTVVDSARFAGNFLTYDSSTPETAPLAQLLGAPSVSYVKNGAYVRQFAKNKILFGASGYRSGPSQTLDVTTGDYNLSGKTDIYLSFTSLLEQNQDSIEGIEVSNDQGATWHPVVYYLNTGDIVLTNNVIDVNATYTTTAGDIAITDDGSGGYYGAFLKASLDDAVGAATQGRLDDNAADGTRIEKIRVAAADNQAAVRFRIFYAGTDSWYLGLDDFGLYSIPAQAEARLSVSLSNGSATLSWPVLPGYILQTNTGFAPGDWTAVQGVTGNSYVYSVKLNEPARFFRLAKPTP